MRIRVRNLFDTKSGIRDGIIRIRDKHPGSTTPHYGTRDMINFLSDFTDCVGYDITGG
jgi:hypothetical protein